MNLIFPSFFEALSYFRKDKWLIVLGMIPVLIGLAIYYYMGSWIYGDLLVFGQDYIRSKMASQSWLNFLTTILVVVLTVAFYFLVSWSFVIVVSLFASPFNDMMSSRVERLLLNEKSVHIGESLSSAFGKFFFTILNEGKKILFIIFVSLLGLVLSLFIPPLSILVSSALIAVSFIDYSWGRHNLKLGSCLRSYRKSFLTYTLAGALFLVFISIPIVNLFMLPFAVVYFTVLFVKLDLRKIE